MTQALGEPFSVRANWSTEVCDVEHRQRQGRCKVDSMNESFDLVVDETRYKIPWPGSASEMVARHNSEPPFQVYQTEPKVSQVYFWQSFGTAAFVYDHATWFSLYGLAEAGTESKLLGNVVRVGSGAVALLSGGAVDVRGEVPPDTIFCLQGRALKPWDSCKDRFLVPHALEHAILGKEDYLVEGAVK